jgi:hypothetical protein
MYEFLDRLINIALPRVRDFRGVSPKSFDGRGNYTLGMRDQLIFPEIDYMKVDKSKGMNITIVTTAKTTSRRGVTNVDDRPDRGHADPDPQRYPVASRPRRAPRVEAEGGDRPHPQERGLHPQLQAGREGR